MQQSIRAVLPDQAVVNEMKNFHPGKGRTVLVAVGKAAWQMAHAAVKEYPDIKEGIVITKYGHIKSDIPRLILLEAGHPIPDENSFRAAEIALSMVRPLGKGDTVLFLLSGGGSALFECPLISGEELQYITDQLLMGGADIVEINTIRKRLSKIKGGRFALEAAPAQVYSIILSDIIGDPVDMIASGPTYPDSSTCLQALQVADKYRLNLSEQARKLLLEETPKELTNIETHISGSVTELCNAAAVACKALGYEPVILTDRLCCEAREAGSFLASILKSHAGLGKRMAFIAGGETVVHVRGSGIGGRNQELALAAAPGIAGVKNAAVFSFGSDGTDGPTDAAGGYVDGDTMERLEKLKIDLYDCMQNNDAYHALESIDGLLITGPTGTNVNDVSIGLLA